MTLGHQIVAWCTKYLNDIDGNGRWKFTHEQYRFILWWYAVDERGRFVYRKGVLQRLKGWGKDPLAAVMCLVEFVGPSQFAGWTDESPVWWPEEIVPKDGMYPVGKAHPRAWVQIAAVNQAQTRNTMTLFPSLMSKRLIEEYGIKPGTELIRARMGRCRIEAVTSNPRSLEGGRSTFVLMNETHHWIKGNQGDAMYETVANNTAKMSCRYLAITNAFLPGEDSVGERMRSLWERVQEGREPDTGLLYDSIEADERTPLTEAGLRVMLPILRGDAVWLDVDSILSVALDSSISEARRRRMWLNQIVSDKDSLYTRDMLKRISRDDATLKPGDEVVLGFDGARYEDDTVLVAIRIRDRMTFVLDSWGKPATWDTKEHGKWQVNVEAVDSKVRWAFRTFRVKAMFADVNLWESYIAEWTKDYGKQLVVKATPAQPIAFDMRNNVKETTRAHERFMAAISDASLFYDGDSVLRHHTMNVRRYETTYGTYFRKESDDSHRKIDAYASWLLAYEALHRYLTNGKPDKTKTGAGYFM